jgi:hypothetical protein
MARVVDATRAAVEMSLVMRVMMTDEKILGKMILF